MTSSHVAASTYIQQIRNRNRRPPLKQIRLHVRSGLVHRCSAIGGCQCVCACVCICVCLCLFDCAYVYMPRQGEQMNKGTLLWIMGVCKGHPVPTLSSPTPSWLRISVLKRGRGEEVQRVKLAPPPPSLLPLSSLFRDKIRRYADDISLFVVEKKNHICLLCKEPGGGVNEAHRPETITR